MSLLESLAKSVLKDPYFTELFYKAENVYSKDFFNEQSLNSTFSDKELNDILRFSEILSTGRSSHERNLAFKVLSLLYPRYQKSDNFIFHANGILTRLGNFPSLSLVTKEDKRYDTIDTLIDKIVKHDLQKVPGGEGTFTDGQYEVFEKLIRSNHYSFSGPTSFGKSFVMDAYIKYLITERPGLDNIVILVPTRALINQVSRRLRKEVTNPKYTVLTHPKVPQFFGGESRKYIFVFTPERLVSYFSNLDNPSIQYMFVDEAQKIVQENDSRSPLYYHAISMADRKSVKLYFASPNIPNADVFLEIFDKSTNESVSIQDTPVAQNRYFVDFVDKQQWTFYDLVDEPIQTDYTNDVDFNDLLRNLGKEDKNIIYCNSVRDTVMYAIEFAEERPKVDDPQITDLIKYIKKSVHRDYFLIDCLEKGIAFHFGRLPQRIRERVEDLYSTGKINYLFCTSTLLEGVNLPAKNIFILNNKIGISNFSKIDFWNLAGRAGRLNKELSGNIICVRLEENKWNIDVAKNVMANKGEETLKPVILTGRKNFYNNLNSSLTGERFSRKKTSRNEEEFWNGYANILYTHEASGIDSLLMNNFMKSTDTGKKLLAKISKSNSVPAYILEQSITIKPIYQNKLLDQIKDSKMATYYPTDIKYEDCLVLLEFMYKKYRWDIEESKGNKPMVFSSERLKYLASLMASWINSQPLNLVIRNMITYHENEGKIWMQSVREYERFDRGDKLHINEVINNLIYDIDNFLRFRIKNYLTNYELLVKSVKGDVIEPWSSYIEYGTCKKEIIALQDIGVSRHLATYLFENHSDSFQSSNGEITYIDLSQILTTIDEEDSDEKSELEEVFLGGSAIEDNI